MKFKLKIKKKTVILGLCLIITLMIVGYVMGYAIGIAILRKGIEF